MSAIEGRRATLVLFRNGMPARVVGTLLLAGSVIMGLVFGELASRGESVRCEPPAQGAMACVQIDSWPIVAPREIALSPVVAVQTRASTTSRGTNVVLLLAHADATVSSFEGVGALGERAETVALQMNRQLASGREAQTFAMREANVGFAMVMLIVFSLLPLLLIFGLFARVQIFGGSSARVVVGRGLLPARQLTFGPASPPALVMQARVVGGDTVHVLSVRGDGAALELTSLRSEDACRALQEKIRAALEERT